MAFSITILTQYFPPETGAPQYRLLELCKALKKRGCEVNVLTAMPNYPKMEIFDNYKGKKYCKEEIDGIIVHRAPIYVSSSKSIISRLRNYFSFVYSSWKIGKKVLPDSDFLMVESPPLFLAYSAIKLAKIKKAKLITNISDLWPESAEKLGIITNPLLLKPAYRLEKRLYKKSFLITCQTLGIEKSIKERFPDRNTYWLPNGVNPAVFNKFETPDDWKLSNGFSVCDKLFLYAGIIGHAQKLETIIEAAGEICNRTEIHFILLGSGPCKEELQQICTEKKLVNVHFPDPVDRSSMPGIIDSCYATIVPLRKLELFKGAIPSKIFESLAMEKPVILGVEGEAKMLFIDTASAGLAFEPENGSDLADKVIYLADNKETRDQLGHNGKEYVLEKFNRDKIGEQFFNLLNSK